MIDARHQLLVEVIAEGQVLALRSLFNAHATVILSDDCAVVLAPGDVALAQISDGVGRVEQPPLATSGSALAQLYRLAARYDLDPAFPEPVLAAAETICESPGFDAPALRDLSALPFVTIDYEHSHDLDQALFIEAAADGATVVYYALADAAYYVPPASPLFAEALRRGASYYLPGLTIPMLPRSLSEGVISLNQGVDRRAAVFKMVLDSRGEARETMLFRARIHSCRKLTYNGVQAFLDDPDSSELRDAPFAESLRLLREVGQRRMALADAANVVRFHRVSLEVSVSGDERLGFEVVGETRSIVEEWNAQISLLCNAEGAALLRTNGARANDVQGVYRVHPAPEPDALAGLARRVRLLAQRRGFDPAVWSWDPERETLARYLERLPRDGDPGRLTRAISRQAMMLNQPSHYASEAAPHYGVGAAAYSRFSAPMREIVGIFSHKEAFESLEGGVSPADDDDLALQAAVINAGNRSRRVQAEITKAANKLALDALFETELARPKASRRSFQGTVMGLRQGKLYVQFDEPPVEVKVYFRDLGPHVVADDEELSVRLSRRERITLGDALVLRVAGYDERRDRWRFERV